jgi:hypothetical protein
VNRGTILVVVLVVAGGGYFLYRYLSGASSSVSLPTLDLSSGAGSGVDMGSTSQSPSGVHPEYDSLIANAANQYDVDPAVLKAIVATESGFNPNSINPEQTFSLGGVTYSQNDAKGRSALVAWIKQQNKPETIGLNPSCGLAQVRISIARAFISGVDAVDLFDPQTCLEAASALLQQLFNAGITLDTIDAYNVGQNLVPRNLPYRDKVNGYYKQFAGDFV